MSKAGDPALVVVTGLPGTGKTTIAERLGDRLSFPVLRKDAFKEILFDRLGWSDEDWSDLLDEACYDMLWSLCDTELRAGRTIIVESNFEPEVHAARIAELGQQHQARLIEVHCRTDRPVLVERFKERVESGERHPGHAEQSEEVMEEEAIPKLLHDPEPWLGVTEARRGVDTTDRDAVDIDEISRWVAAKLERTDEP
jgi:predicted kinase